MNLTSVLVSVCPDCGSQYPIEREHVCREQGLRKSLELIESLINIVEDGAGLLWLIRIAYRLKANTNGIGLYRDRAALARRACELGFSE